MWSLFPSVSFRFGLPLKQESHAKLISRPSLPSLRHKESLSFTLSRGERERERESDHSQTNHSLVTLPVSSAGGCVVVSAPIFCLCFISSRGGWVAVFFSICLSLSMLINTVRVVRWGSTFLCLFLSFQTPQPNQLYFRQKITTTKPTLP